MNRRLRERQREIRRRAVLLFGSKQERPPKPIGTGEGQILDGMLRLEAQKMMKRKKRGWR